MSARPAAGGGRWVDVAPERLDRWLDNFAGRHGAWTAAGLLLTAEDGATAELSPAPGAPPVMELAELREAAGQPRRIGLLLARKGAVAVGVAQGMTLVTSKVDRNYVQGRTAAGGWSQQRFARRRDNQAKAAAADGAEIAARILLPELKKLAAVVAGGDRTAVDTILTTPNLQPLAALLSERFLEVPEPRRTVLEDAIGQARAIRILVRDA